MLLEKKCSQIKLKSKLTSLAIQKKYNKKQTPDQLIYIQYFNMLL